MRLIISGAGGHGQVVADIARQMRRYDQIYFLDDHAEKNDVIGKCTDYLRFKDTDTEMYPAFGNNEVRLEWENRLLKEREFFLQKSFIPLLMSARLLRLQKDV